MLARLDLYSAMTVNHRLTAGPRDN